MTKLAFAVGVATLGAAAILTTHAGSRLNTPQATEVAVQSPAAQQPVVASATSCSHPGSSMQGPQLTGLALQSFEAYQPVVAAVTLRSGETVDVR